MKEPGYSDLAILNSKGTDVITEYNTKINGNNISVKLVCRLGFMKCTHKNVINQ